MNVDAKNARVGHKWANSFSMTVNEFLGTIAAQFHLIVIGANISNAFAEAPAPEDTFYILPDNTFLDWWINHLKRDPIPPNYVLKVNHALLGHPEAAHLWEHHIDPILKL